MRRSRTERLPQAGSRRHCGYLGVGESTFLMLVWKKGIPKAHLRCQIQLRNTGRCNHADSAGSSNSPSNADAIPCLRTIRPIIPLRCQAASRAGRSASDGLFFCVKSGETAHLQCHRWEAMDHTGIHACRIHRLSLEKSELPTKSLCRSRQKRSRYIEL